MMKTLKDKAQLQDREFENIFPYSARDVMCPNKGGILKTDEEVWNKWKTLILLLKPTEMP